MTKSGLVAKIAKALGPTQQNAEHALNAAFDTIKNALKKGKKIILAGFKVSKRAARTGKSPRTKEEIKTPASKVPVFRPGKNKKKQLRSNFKKTAKK